MNDFPTLHKFPEDSVRRDYDVFELFPDGSTVWRACVLGMGNAERKLRDLGRESNNKFFAINLQERAEPMVQLLKSSLRLDRRRAR
jgi:hypothetical protein